MWSIDSRHSVLLVVSAGDCLAVDLVKTVLSLDKKAKEILDQRPNAE
jgi:hypothetical protein